MRRRWKARERGSHWAREPEFGPSRVMRQLVARHHDGGDDDRSGEGQGREETRKRRHVREKPSNFEKVRPSPRPLFFLS